MPGNHVAQVHELVALWNAGARNLAMIGRLLDPAVELESPFSSVAGAPYRGYAGIEQWIRDVDEQFSQWHLRLDDVHDVDHRVLAIGGVHGRGRASGIVVDFPSAVVLSFASDHRITRLSIYLDIEEALRAVGPAG